MTTALHLATQFTSLLATITTIAATTHVLSMWLVLPVFFTLQVGILVFLLISASLPPITSVRIRITTLVAVEASLWFLWASTHQIGGGLGLEAWAMQIVVAYTLWSLIVGGVLLYAIDVHTLLPHLLARRAVPVNEMQRKLDDIAAAEEGRWINVQLAESHAAKADSRDSPTSTGSSPYEGETGRFNDTLRYINQPTASIPQALYSLQGRRNPSVRRKIFFKKRLKAQERLVDARTLHRAIRARRNQLRRPKAIIGY